MIAKVRKQPCESKCHLSAIWDADQAFELDCSLLPGREAAIAEIYDAAIAEIDLAAT